jgi:hypothetical protein
MSLGAAVWPLAALTVVNGTEKLIISTTFGYMSKGSLTCQDLDPIEA